MDPFSRAPDEGLENIDEPMSWEPSRQFLQIAIRVVALGSIGFICVVLLLAPQQHARMVGPAFLAGVSAVAWLLQAGDRIRSGGVLLVVGSWIVSTGICVFNGGVRTPVVIAYPLLIVLAGWLLGIRAGIVVAALSVAATLGFVIAEVQVLDRVGRGAGEHVPFANIDAASEGGFSVHD